MALESKYWREHHGYAWTITQRRIHGIVPEQTLAAWMEDGQEKMKEGCGQDDRAFQTCMLLQKKERVNPEGDLGIMRSISDWLRWYLDESLDFRLDAGMS